MACYEHHITAAVKTLLKVVNLAKFTVVLQPESKCLFMKGVEVRLS